MQISARIILCCFKQHLQPAAVRGNRDSVIVVLMHAIISIRCQGKVSNLLLSLALGLGFQKEEPRKVGPSCAVPFIRRVLYMFYSTYLITFSFPP